MPARSGPDRSDRTLKWEVRSAPVLIERVIPHFRRYPMRSGKQRDFEGLARVCELIAERQHLEPRGLRQIVEIAARMNPSGRRGYDPREILTSLEMKA